MGITAGKSKAAPARAFNNNVNTMHETWKAYEEQRRRMTESLRRSKSKT